MIDNVMLPVFEVLLADIRARKTPGSPFIVGITGIDCAGKTLFSESFRSFLESRHLKTQVIHLDDFHNPRKIRRSGFGPDELYYERIKQGYSFNFDRLIKELLRPICEENCLTKSLTSVNWRDDSAYETCYSVTSDTIVLLEGIFLFLDIIARYLDYTIFLDITLDECKKRATARDPGDLFQSYERKYIPAFVQYLAEYPPASHAAIIIDNTDWNHPRIT